MNTTDRFEENLSVCLREERIKFTHSKEEAWEALQPKIAATSYGILSRQRRTIGLWAAAAAILIACTCFLAILMGSNSILSDKEMIASHILPDGSEIALNVNSEITYNSLLWFFQRDIKLCRGEAFFNVKKGSSFTVETPNGDVDVLGTSFNILLNGDSLEVSCQTGLVRVVPKGDRGEHHLGPGEGLISKGINTTLVRVNSAAIASWSKAEFSFDNVALSEVFKLLEMQRGYTFKTDSLKGMSYTGQFRKSQELNEILDIICLPLNLTYDIQASEKLVVITKIH